MTPQEKRAYVKALHPIVSRVRTDVSAIKRNGLVSWTPEPLTTANMEQHVNGGTPRGVCPIRAGESTTMLSVLDFDSHDGESTWGEMVAAATDVAACLSMMGYNPVAFRSGGGRGVHIYVLWDTPQDAYSVREAMGAVIAMCGYKNSNMGGVKGGSIEVFPRQDEVGVGEFGNQFFLPMAGHSEPLDLDLGLCLGRDAVLTMAWPTSTPVPALDRPERPVHALTEGVDGLDKVVSALAAIVNDGSDKSPDYNGWRDIGFAVHEATGGSDEGRSAFMEWSSQNPRHNEKFASERVWEYIKPAEKRGNAVTRATLYAKARETGWGVVMASPEGFTDVVVHKPAGAGAVSAEVTEDEELPGYERDKKGLILTTIGNVVMACRRPDICGWRIGHDEFRDELMVAPPGVDGQRAWRAFTDADYTRLRIRLHLHGIENIGPELIKDAVYLVAQDNRFDSAILWINGLKHDGVQRVETFVSVYLQGADTEYSRACALYMWTALAGRVMEPGCQADMVPVLMGAQGLRKTSAVKAMSPAKDFFGEIDVAQSDDNMSRKMRGKLIAEIGELRGLRVKEQEAVKAFITRTDEEWIPKYKEFGTKFARRLLFVGTTNQKQFLGDDTGNRRWLPLAVGKADIERLKRDVLQLWAEARDLWLGGGVQWEPAQRLAETVHGEHEFDDAWEDKVGDWLDSADFDNGKVSDRPYLTTSMVLVEAMGIMVGRASKNDEMRAGTVLRKLGYERVDKRVNNRMRKVYVAALYPPKKGEAAT